jgi:hypothetical protein
MRSAQEAEGATRGELPVGSFDDVRKPDALPMSSTRICNPKCLELNSLGQIRERKVDDSERQ